MKATVLLIMMLACTAFAKSDFEKMRERGAAQNASAQVAKGISIRKNVLQKIAQKFAAGEPMATGLKCAELDSNSAHCDFKTVSGRTCRVRLGQFDVKFSHCAFRGGVIRSVSYGNYKSEVECYPSPDQDYPYTTITLSKAEYFKVTGEKPPQNEVLGNCLF